MLNWSNKPPNNEWGEWRGRMTAVVDANGARLTELTTELMARMGTQDLHFNRRMDKQDRAILSILDQTKSTNGRVTALEARDAVNEAIKDEDARQRDLWRWRIATIVVLASGAAGTVVGVLLQHLVN